MRFGCKKISFSVAGFLMLLFSLNAPVFADEMGVNLNLAESVAIDVQSDVVLNLQASNNGTFGQTPLLVRAATNARGGYTIVLSTTSVDLTSDTLDATLNDYPTIPALSSVTGGRTAAEFAANASDNNRWGISIDNTDSFNPIALSSILKETDAPTGATPDTTTINIGSKVDYDTPTGAYSTTLNFEITANIIIPDLAYAYRINGKTKTAQGYYVMQDMNPDICAAADTESELQVQDIRDNKLYWILKAKDGKCWMTQNLDLDLETTPTNVAALTSENTDLNTWNGRDNNNKYTAADGYSEADGVITWTPPRDTLTPNASGGVTWTNDQNFIKSVDVGNWFQTDVYFVKSECTGASPWCNYLTGYDRGKYYQTNDPTPLQMHYHMGNYYNWIAMVATNTLSEFSSSTASNTANNPKNSICPKGWRMPVYASDATKSDFAILSSYYPSTDSSKLDLGFFSAPLYFNRAGVMRNNSLQYAGESGGYYTSTIDNSSKEFNLDFKSDTLKFNNSQEGWRGRSLRCVAR